MTVFSEMGLPETLVSALTKINFHKPTPIQRDTLPFALDGRDILGTAATGTGKTGAFAIPMVAKLINNPSSTAIVMTPTRELATQVLTTIQPLLLNHREIRTALLIGGESMPKQFSQLRNAPRIIVGTPGRINDHLARGTLKLGQCDFLVLDEADRMLDMGFGVQIEKIIAQMPKERQTLMFSATLPREIMKMAQNYLRNPERVTVDQTHQPAAKIKQELIHVSESEKYPKLLEQLTQREGSVIIFVKTKYGSERLADRLTKANHVADALHGDLQQRRRDRVTQNFRDGKFRILVATDVAARGLDIPHIANVINFDLPQCPEDYIHRIGRTARAGAEGTAINLLTPADGDKWRAIHRLMFPGEAANLPRGEQRSNPRRKFGGGGGKGYGGYKGKNPRGGEYKPADRSERGDRPAHASQGANGNSGHSEPRREHTGGEQRHSEHRRSEQPRSEHHRGEPSRHEHPRGERKRDDRPDGRPEGRPGAPKKFFGKKRFGGGKRPSSNNAA